MPALLVLVVLVLVLGLGLLRLESGVEGYLYEEVFRLVWWMFLT